MRLATRKDTRRVRLPPRQQRKERDAPDTRREYLIRSLQYFIFVNITRPAPAIFLGQQFTLTYNASKRVAFLTVTTKPHQPNKERLAHVSGGTAPSSIRCGGPAPSEPFSKGHSLNKARCRDEVSSRMSHHPISFSVYSNTLYILPFDDTPGGSWAWQGMENTGCQNRRDLAGTNETKHAQYVCCRIISLSVCTMLV